MQLYKEDTLTLLKPLCVKKKEQEILYLFAFHRNTKNTVTGTNSFMSFSSTDHDLRHSPFQLSE